MKNKISQSIGFKILLVYTLLSLVNISFVISIIFENQVDLISKNIKLESERQLAKLISSMKKFTHETQKGALFDIRNYKETLNQVIKFIGPHFDDYLIFTDKGVITYKSSARIKSPKTLIVFIDGYEIGGDIMAVALGVDEKGGKMALSMRQGGTENEGVVKSLFDDMEGRGLKKDRPILFVIDGSKAIHAAITKRFEKYFIQRCREHKKRNILDHAPVAMKEEAQNRIDEAYAERDYDKARSMMVSFSAWADKINPDMGA